MCKLFINADPEQWISYTHSLRIDGMVTSVRMENCFWTILEEVAQRDDMNTPQLITRLYHESSMPGTTSEISLHSCGYAPCVISRCN